MSARPRGVSSASDRWINFTWLERGTVKTVRRNAYTTKKGTNNEKKLAAEVRDEKELAKERRNEVSRKRYAEDADYREKLLAYQREYKREHRGPPPPLTPEEKDKRNARDRERWATDPDYRAGKLVFHAENARRQELKRRYGLSWEDYIRRCWRAKAAPAPSANANSPTHRSLIISDLVNPKSNLKACR